MSSIYIFKRKRKQPDGSHKTDKCYTAEIQLGRQAKFQRGTGATTQRDARKIARLYLKEAEATLKQQRDPKLTIDKLFGGYVAEHVSTLRSRETAIIRLDRLLETLDARYISEISPTVLTHYIQTRRNHGVSPATINRELSQLRAAMRYAKESWSAKIPKINWKFFTQTEPKERIVTEKLENVQAIFNHLPQHILECALFCYYTSCRLNAMQTAQWTKVDFTKKQIIMLNKGGAELVFPLSNGAITILEQASFQNYNLPNDTIFNTRNRRKHWEAARKKANMSHFNWHDIRHFTATTLSEQGENTRMIQTILKHSDIATTQKYTHVQTEAARTALNKLPIMD